ncbi:Site-specific DNA recombinase [Bradyrhizobium yuanmingense]|uniref:Site-specific DNA recombinase n=1 Tax=Bradyrhizobium yuanmingense TaxID=108015 RepID=A0A1C3UQC7_9BRAD|nr:recombinase family protein [Bradyrhizobium yuanmingense]TWI32124.1 DNA invertase Pin-like site-specific DNA recombinase [Bradyrhizobium yuanmingense]SCB17659.1 Site-specific DNA recombinase [Bradyrhizobium yuanmingense]
MQKNVLPPDVSLRGLKAAQYVRMSTDAQKYSIENQMAAIAAHAARRHLTIVRTYADAGRSGLRIQGRAGLQDLIRDVQLGRADFDCVLVYDITRWGRFQDVDESAYYEFICKRAGVRVHYCADEFENDGSLASIVLKNIKRVAAADFSKQLSKKVFLGQCHVVSLGYWRGGPAGYGLRRMLLDEHGKPKGVLEYGEHKSLKSQRTVLVPGPATEQRVVRRIFSAFVDEKKTRTQIAVELNADGIHNARGKPWTSLTISNTLKNEAYAGHLVYNRRSQKLGEKQVANPPEMWVRRNNAFKHLISPQLFAQAQRRLNEVEFGRVLTDAQMLDRLRTLLRQKGRLSLKLMMTTKGIPHSKTYAQRFGSLAEAFRRVGFEPKPRYCFRETAARTDRLIASVARDIITEVEKRRRSITFLQELRLLTVSSSVTISVTLARVVSDGERYPGPAPRWELQRLEYKKSDLVLVVRLAATNGQIQDFFLLPTANLPKTRDGRVRISARVFGEFRCPTFPAVISALHQRLDGPQFSLEGPARKLSRPSAIRNHASTTTPGRPTTPRTPGRPKKQTARARR